MECDLFPRAAWRELSITTCECRSLDSAGWTWMREPGSKAADKCLSLAFLGGTIQGRVAPYSRAEAAGCVTLWSCGPLKDVPLGVGVSSFAVSLLLFFHFCYPGIASGVRVCCFSLCPWTGSAVAGWAGQIYRNPETSIFPSAIASQVRELLKTNWREKEQASI